MARKQPVGEDKTSQDSNPEDLLDESEKYFPPIEDTVQVLSSLEGRGGTLEYIQKWISECNDITVDVMSVSNTLGITVLNVRRSTYINEQIICLRTHLELLLKRGESMKGRHPLSARVRWVDYDAAYRRRQQTDFIVNLYHKDIIAFLDDDFVLFEKRIRNALYKSVSVARCGL